MNVVLTQPLTLLVKELPRFPDLGLGYLASSLVKKGHNVDIIDWNMIPNENSLRNRIANYEPDLVGLKVFTKDVFAAKETLKMIRAVVPDACIIIGGPHPSCVEDPLDLLDDFIECDFAIRGEAESGLPMLLDMLAEKSIQNLSGDELLKVPGLVWRHGEGAVENERYSNDDLDGLGFPLWTAINPKNYQDFFAAPIITTRGCPGKCTFCGAFNVNGRRIRSRSVENIFKEITMLYNEYGVRSLMFQDNCFKYNARNLMVICDKIIESGMDIEWDCVTYESLQNLTDETLSIMYRAGCRMVHMGIETGSKKTRKIMNKWCSLDEIKERTVMMRKGGIWGGSMVHDGVS